MMIYVLEHFGVAVNAIAGVLAARGRQVDLFGVVVLALVTAFGGGTIRDLCLGEDTKVFWIEDSNYIVTGLIVATAAFFGARWLKTPRRFLELADAFGLAMFTIIGTQKALAAGVSGTLAVVLGTMTGVAGGVLRDVLVNELPLVFRTEIRLYATAAVAGALVYVVARLILPSPEWAAITGSATTLALRLAAMRWELALPEFRTKE